MAINNKRHYQWRERCQFTSDKPSMTVQAAKDTSDVNYIVKRYQRTGEMPPNPRGVEGQFMDCTPFQEELTEAYNSAKERQSDIEAEIQQKRAEALERAKKPVNRDPEAPASGGASPNEPQPPKDPAPPDGGAQ